MFRSAIIAVTALAAIVGAQNTTLEPTGSTQYFYGTDGSLQIDPNTVEPSLRSAWCLGQQNNCPEVCGGQVSENRCDDTTLQWSCTCADNSTPNITDYAAMMPAYICEKWKELCVAANPNERAPQQACQSITCGMQNASDASASSSSSSSAAPESTSSSPSQTSGGASQTTASSSESASASATNTGAAAALNIPQAYGSSILAAGLLGIFGLAL